MPRYGHDGHDASCPLRPKQLAECRPDTLVFFLYSLFLSFSFPLCRSPFPVPSRLLRSFCRFPFVSSIAFFAFPFAYLLSLMADSVVLSRFYTPCIACEPASLYSPCVLSCSFLPLLIFSYIFLHVFFAFFEFNLNVVCFILSCAGGYCLCCLLYVGF